DQSDRARERLSNRAAAPLWLARRRKRDAAPLRVARGPIEHGDVTDQARDRALRLAGERVGDRAPLSALARDPHLHELVVGECAIERRHHTSADPAAPICTTGSSAWASRRR